MSNTLIRERVEHLLNTFSGLSDWERAFLGNIADWHRLSDKQAAKLGSIEARATAEPIDAKTAFLDAMKAAGVVPDEPIADRLGPDKIRFHCVGDRKGRRNGWAKFYDDGMPAGSFGSYKLSLSVNWCSVDHRDLSSEERERMARESEEKARHRLAERQAMHLVIAEQCRVIWAAGVTPDPTHGYLLAKGLSGEGLRQLPDEAAGGLAALPMFADAGDVRRQLGGAVLVPMLDDDGQLWNLQRIWPRGRKLYIKDARSTGLHMMVGDPGDEIVVAEGYGNGAVVRRAVGLPVAIAFTWSNLEHVARHWRRRCLEADIIIAADDDAHLVDHPQIQRNIGLEAAYAAARAVGGRVALPPRKAA